METVNGLILVLLLLSDQQSADLATQLAQGLERDYGTQIELVVDPAAGKRLQAFGISTGDILADRHLGEQLTKYEKVVLIHLEDALNAGDRVAAAQIWFDGRSESFVAIAGNGGDPSIDLFNGINRLLRPYLRPQADSGQTAEAPLSVLVERGAWQPLLGVLASRADKQPKEWYYMTLAYVRLEQRDAAVATVNAFRDAFPKHFLLHAAEALVPPPRATPAEIEAALPAGDGLPSEPVAEEPSGRGTYELTETVEVHLDDELRQRLQAAKAAAEAAMAAETPVPAGPLAPSDGPAATDDTP